MELAADAEQPAELEWLAGIHYEIGKALLAEGKPQDALSHLRESLKGNRAFIPAHVAMGDAYLKAGDQREAMRTWERAAEATPEPVLLQMIMTADSDIQRQAAAAFFARWREFGRRDPQRPEWVAPTLTVVLLVEFIGT